MSRVSLLVGTMALLFLTACALATPTPAATTPAPGSLITREQAIEIALQRLTSMPEVTAVENPRNPVARLMKLREYDPLMPDPDTPVWVVQYEGESYGAGISDPRTKYSYATVVIDAQSGRMIAQSRTFAPRL